MKYWRSIAIALIAACATRSAPPPSNVRTEPPPPPKMKRGEPIPAGALVALSTLTPGVLVSFTVDEQGRTREGAARGITRRVDGCIATQVARWQFPAPKDPAGQPTDARFALGLELDVD